MASHPHTEVTKVADYVTERLSGEDCARFEEHLISCQECLDQLETIERFRRGLRTMSAEDVTQSASIDSSGFLFPFARLRQWQRATLVLVPVLALLIFQYAMYVTALGRVHEELRHMNTDYATLQRQYEEQRRDVSGLKKQLQSSQDLIHQAETELTWRGQPKGQVVQQRHLSPGSGISLPVFVLSVMRDDGTELSYPGNEISIPPSSPWVVLALEHEPDPQARFFRAALFDAENESIWDSGDLSISKDMIAVSVESRLLTRGDYRLRLEGCMASAHCHPAGRYFFRVTSVK